MQRALTVLAVVAFAGCGSESRSSDSCAESLCESALAITVDHESGSFAPGVYTFDVAFDGLRTAEDCMVQESPQPTVRCTGGLVTPVVNNFAVTGFQVKGPAANRAVITIRQPCVQRELATRTFEPTYACPTGCRSATASMVVTSGAGFTICPDAGAD